ncbi:hypothetical protein QNI19_38925 [Cytophagaceae bacterium DM2B3-1]|uniref:DUF1835 domain-containing protein n=1 Tax=Xanthocytophaga flava TaxID=3048013 RepID=A0ABT7D136_9BACT|nr:hypothetical protein [Xanthocytophaga flavus]MDJ1470975.1 hypothetical protein [Xanthocytophaga flavus]MDJ1498965.1 hypothetical protein [Xanthocytophaga flavus]
MRMYVLSTSGFDKIQNTIYPDLNPDKIPDRYFLNENISYFDHFLPASTSFANMIPMYIGDRPSERIHIICDLHSWIRRNPPGLMYPVSVRFKELLEGFTLFYSRFYSGSVIWYEDGNPYTEKEYPYFVWHLLTDKDVELIDFSSSTFGNYEFITSSWESNEQIQVDGYKELLEKKEALDWSDWGFRRAVMKPEFREIDAISIHRYGIVISERLKEAIESAQLTNVSITPCPIEFEISDQI